MLAGRVFQVSVTVLQLAEVCRSTTPPVELTKRNEKGCTYGEVLKDMLYKDNILLLGLYRTTTESVISKSESAKYRQILFDGAAPRRSQKKIWQQVVRTLPRKEVLSLVTFCSLL